jgi:hypothetical protein
VIRHFHFAIRPVPFRPGRPEKVAALSLPRSIFIRVVDNLRDRSRIALRVLRGFVRILGYNSAALLQAGRCTWGSDISSVDVTSTLTRNKSESARDVAGHIHQGILIPIRYRTTRTLRKSLYSSSSSRCMFSATQHIAFHEKIDIERREVTRNRFQSARRKATRSFFS